MKRRTFLASGALIAAPIPSLAVDKLVSVTRDGGEILSIPAKDFVGLSKFSTFGSVDNKLGLVEHVGIWYKKDGEDSFFSTDQPHDELLSAIDRPYEKAPFGVRFL